MKTCVMRYFFYTLFLFPSIWIVSDSTGTLHVHVLYTCTFKISVFFSFLNSLLSYVVPPPSKQANCEERMHAVSNTRQRPNQLLRKLFLSLSVSPPLSQSAVRGKERKKEKGEKCFRLLFFLASKRQLLAVERKIDPRHPNIKLPLLQIHGTKKERK